MRRRAHLRPARRNPDTPGIRGRTPAHLVAAASFLNSVASKTSLISWILALSTRRNSAKRNVPAGWLTSQSYRKAASFPTRSSLSMRTALSVFTKAMSPRTNESAAGCRHAQPAEVVAPSSRMRTCARFWESGVGQSERGAAPSGGQRELDARGAGWQIRTAGHAPRHHHAVRRLDVDRRGEINHAA